MTLHEHYTAAVAEYLNRLTYRNLQPTTIRNYTGTLNAFGAFLANSDTEDMYEAVEQWKEDMLRNGNKESSVRQKMTTLKIFFDKATKRSFPASLRFTENPVDMDEAPKQITKPYDELLTDDQVISLFENKPPYHAVSALWPRNYAMLMLLINEKIRNNELLSLSLSDVDMNYHEIRIRNAKGRKQRTLDLSPLSEQALIQYLNANIRPAYLRDDDYLFGTTSAKEFQPGETHDAERWHKGSNAWLSEVIRTLVLAKTGTDNIRTHDCRHIGSRIALNAGATVEELQGMLGHSSVALVERYAGRLQQRRRRESAKTVLAARDAAAEQLRKKNNAEQQVIPLFA